MLIDLTDDICSFTCSSWAAKKKMNFIFDAIVEEVIVSDGVYGRNYDLIVLPFFRDHEFFDRLGPIYPSVVFIIEFGFVYICLFGNFVDYCLRLKWVFDVEGSIVQFRNVRVSSD